jgi:hypothetical protein
MTRREACALFAFLPLAAGRASAAPIPPSPRLSIDTLVGVWRYRWRDMVDGFICFQADGTYYSRHTADGAVSFHGTWELHGGVLTLHESIITDESRVHVKDYAIQLAGRYPVFAGQCGEASVKLSEPRPLAP